jgi:hypothetical protein
LSGDPLPGITIEGAIAPGDYQKLVDATVADRRAHAVWLASPGGNLKEALRMGHLIRRLGLAVWVPFSKAEPLVTLKDPANNTCASSCFLLYAAGVRRQGLVLGLHRPTLPADEYFALGLDGAVAAHRVIAEAVTGYLEFMGVPSKYASLMLSPNGGGMVWLSAEDIRNDLDGVPAGYVDALRAACPLYLSTDDDHQPLPAARPGEQSKEMAGVDCTSRRLMELHEERGAAEKSLVNR